MSRNTCHACGEQVSKKKKESAWNKGPPKWLMLESAVEEETDESDLEDEMDTEEGEQEQEEKRLPVEQVELLENAIKCLVGMDEVHPMVQKLQEFLETKSLLQVWSKRERNSGAWRTGALPIKQNSSAPSKGRKKSGNKRRWLRST